MSSPKLIATSPSYHRTRVDARTRVRGQHNVRQSDWAGGHGILYSSKRRAVHARAGWPLLWRPRTVESLPSYADLWGKSEKVFVPSPQWLGLRFRLTGGRNGAFDA
ncbi:MAG TPA: hypothetical protein VJ301_19010 [Propionibacteriaceae bacterium]|nr:hypothetical protein [Propionibacteriaceae bacterium]